MPAPHGSCRLRVAHTLGEPSHSECRSVPSPPICSTWCLKSTWVRPSSGSMTSLPMGIAYDNSAITMALPHASALTTRGTMVRHACATGQLGKILRFTKFDGPEGDSVSVFCGCRSRRLNVQHRSYPVLATAQDSLELDGEEATPTRATWTLRLRESSVL
eukprot:scaffold106_cov380-Prasinococcus_capsulatus_cf.AAC.26